MSEVIEAARAAEAKELTARGKEPVLTSSGWPLVKRPQRLSGQQEPKLPELAMLNPRTVRAYLLKERLPQSPECRSQT